MTAMDHGRNGHELLGERAGVRVTAVDRVVRVTLCRPQNRNAQSPATWRRLAQVPALLDDQVDVVVLDAEGPSFSAGLDRRLLDPSKADEDSLLALSAHPRAAQDEFVQQAQAAFTWWREVPQVTIALVRGHAIGAGLQLALACDWLVVGDSALLAMREPSLGLIPDLGGTTRLVARVGYERALELCATGRLVDATEAVRLGLALAQSPDAELDAAAGALIDRVLAAPPGTMRALKTLLAAAQPGGAVDRDQLGRERTAQIDRLAALRAVVGGH